MTGSKKAGMPAGRAAGKRTDNTKKKPAGPMRLSIGVAGDQRLAENVIVEVLAAARRCGLAPPDVQILRQPRVGPKVKLISGRKSK
jgi:hypothetical protein